MLCGRSSGRRRFRTRRSSFQPMALARQARLLTVGAPWRQDAIWPCVGDAVSPKLLHDEPHVVDHLYWGEPMSQQGGRTKRKRDVAEGRVSGPAKPTVRSELCRCQGCLPVDRQPTKSSATRPRWIRKNQWSMQRHNLAAVDSNLRTVFFLIRSRVSFGDRTRQRAAS